MFIFMSGLRSRKSKKRKIEGGEEEEDVMEEKEAKGYHHHQNKIHQKNAGYDTNSYKPKFYKANSNKKKLNLQNT